MVKDYPFMWRLTSPPVTSQSVETHELHMNMVKLLVDAGIQRRSRSVEGKYCPAVEKPTFRSPPVDRERRTSCLFNHTPFQQYLCWVILIHFVSNQQPPFRYPTTIVRRKFVSNEPVALMGKRNVNPTHELTTSCTGSPNSPKAVSISSLLLDARFAKR